MNGIMLKDEKPKPLFFFTFILLARNLLVPIGMGHQ
jgi:hypothetical protein